MVLIPIKYDINHCKEWGLVDLQGEIATAEGSLAGLQLGTLYLEKGVPNFIIGHHHLVGKVTELKQPYAVIHKREAQDKYTNERGIEYEVVALVHKKFIFKARPSPIIEKTEK
eukprot:Colp12_sorted_trinity150504_noHs@17078